MQNCETVVTVRSIDLKESSYATSKIALAVACLSVGSGVAAQESGLEEVVVTASKRGATSLMNTAVTATVVTGEQLEMREVRNAEDLQFQTPGMIVDQGSTSPKVAIRGIGHDNFLISAESGVAMYSNDILLGRTQAILGAFFDLERVDVLKGPQGTSFGRNATGGSVNFIGRRPVEGTQLEVGVTGGSFDRKEVFGIFNYGTGDYGVRLGAKYNEDDGFAENPLTGNDLMGVEQTIIKSSFFFAPTETFEGVFRIDYTDEQSTRGAQPMVAIEPFSVPALFGGTPAFDTDEDYKVGVNLEPEADTETTLSSLHLDWDIGEFHLRSITGYYSLDYDIVLDTDESDIAALETPAMAVESDQFSQEFVLGGSAGSVDWLTGVYYLSEDVDQGPPFSIDYFSSLNPTGGIATFADNQELTSMAVFAEGTWNFNDSTRLTAGVRYTEDEKEVDYFQTFITSPILAPSVELVTCDLSDDQTWDDTTWDVTLEHNITDDTFGYVKVGTGFKAGGFNSGQCGGQYEPEELTAYEIGYKGTFRDGAMTLASSAFYYDYSDIQVTQVEPQLGTAGNRVTNAADAEVYGLDLELRTLLTDSFSIDLGLSWIPTADYDEFFSADPLDARADTLDGDPSTQPEILDLSDNRMNRAPEYSGTLGLNYTEDLGSNWQVDARLELYFTDDIAFSPYDRPNSFNATTFPDLKKDSNIQEGYELVNAYVSFYRGDTWTVRLYGKNLTDEYYYSGIVENGSIGHIFADMGRPREGGVQVIYRFAN